TDFRAGVGLVPITQEYPALDLPAALKCDGNLARVDLAGSAPQIGEIRLRVVSRARVKVLGCELRVPEPQTDAAILRQPGDAEPALGVAASRRRNLRVARVQHFVIFVARMRMGAQRRNRVGRNDDTLDRLSLLVNDFSRDCPLGSEHNS